MNQFEFDRLIELHQKGLLEGEEKQLVDDWLNDGSQGSDIEFGEEDLQRVKFKIQQQLGHQAELAPSVLRTNHWRSYGIAATVLLVMSIGYFLWQYTPDGRSIRDDSTMLQAHATVSGVKKVILADGTLVWLKDNSTLKYPDRFPEAGIRHVLLEGEALFEVAKDPDHPFVIEAGTFKTMVLGTSFHIKSGHERFEVTVFTGKVSLSTTQHANTVVVLPNERVVYQGEQPSLSKSAPSEKEYLLKGTEYDMAFDDTPMADVMRRLERKFDVKVSMSNAHLGNCRITADFTDQSLDRTLSMAAQAMNFEFQIDGRQVILSGDGCQ